MDIIWVLLAMAVLYGLPELLRKKRQTVNNYPQIPEKTVESGEFTPKYHSRSANRPTNELKTVPEKMPDFKEQSQYVQMTAAAASIGLEEQPLFSSEQVISGIIWAEILAKPKTIRPYSPLSKH